MRLDVTFVCCDLLSAAWLDMAPQLLANADLVTMVMLTTARSKLCLYPCNAHVQGRGRQGQVVHAANVPDDGVSVRWLE